MDDKAILGEKFSQLLRWEKRKRRENIVIEACLYSILASFLILPFRWLLPEAHSPHYIPAALLLVSLPGLFLLRPWGRREALRAVHCLDSALGLDETAITAWEILGRGEERAAELLVIEAAHARLRAVEPRALFKRRLPWHARLAPLLFLLWLFFAWFDFGARWEGGGKRSGAPTLAEKLRQFARELQEKAEAQGLAETRKTAQALREIADRRLREEIGERELKDRLAGLARQIEDRSRSGEGGADAVVPTGGKEALLDLKAEVESFKPGLAPGAPGGAGRSAERLRERLGSLPRLREEVERNSAGGEPDPKELQSFLEKLEQALAQELDRRALSEIAEFLALLLQGDEGPGRPEPLYGRERGEEEPSGEETEARGNLPGEKPGAKDRLPQAAPPLRARALSQLKGLLGEGEGARLAVRGEAKARKSGVAEEEVLTSYQRKAESEIASEKIPASLKEIVRGYFLSLEMPGKK